ncbi:MAG: orotidine-5'-phosphate decarboxylase, partial [Planctomycetota bacterium]
TINAYLGADGMQPFLDAGGGAFALVRTSNPGGDALQETALAEGGTVADRVAAVVADLGRRVVGRRGYSALGAVVGATRPQAAARLRAAMPEQILLVPGFGAQGGGVDDVRPCFRDDGTGAIVAATRSVIYAFRGDGPGWADEVAEAAAGFADEVGRAVGLR